MQDEIIANDLHIFHFKDPQALSQVEPRYSEEQLAIVRSRFEPYTTPQIFNSFRRKGVHINYWAEGEPYDAFRDAAAHILEERGLITRMGDMPATLIMMDDKSVSREQKGRELDIERRKQNEMHSRGLLRHLAGYTKIQKQFFITHTMSGSFNMIPIDTLSCYVHRKRSALVNVAEWFDPISNDKVSYTWFDFMRIYQSTSRALGSQKWVHLWKRWNNDASICAEVLGVTGNTDGIGLVDTIRIWRLAGLHGVPDYEFNLSGRGHTLGTLYLNSHTKQALLSDAGDCRPETVSAGKSRDLPSNLIGKSLSSQRALGISLRPVKDKSGYFVVVPRSAKRQ